MAVIAFSRPEGRVNIDYPDQMSLGDLEETIAVHISVARLAMSKFIAGEPSVPPDSGREKTNLSKEGQD